MRRYEFFGKVWSSIKRENYENSVGLNVISLSTLITDYNEEVFKLPIFPTE